MSAPCAVTVLPTIPAGDIVRRLVPGNVTEAEACTAWSVSLLGGVGRVRPPFRWAGGVSVHAV
ncbi:MAG TPA: hypothetical protein VGL06_28050 [Pseudonocardiaceae bacterium]